MAKTRAQRKAEKRKREERRQRRAEQRGDESRDEERARQDTQTPMSGDVAEAEAVIETGARPEDYGEHTVEREGDGAPEGGSPVPGVLPEPVTPEPAPEPAEPEAPAPSRADVGAPAAPEAPGRETRDERRERRRREKEERRKARTKDLQKTQKAAPAEREKRRGPVTGFIASCWAELKRVQWPDRDTMVQASAVTIIFVAVAAAYLGALDGAFNWLIKQIL
jgi:preprotein translocase SecE subunit